MWEYFDNFKYFNRPLSKKQLRNLATIGKVPLVEIATKMNAHEYFKTTCNLQKLFKLCKGQLLAEQPLVLLVTGENLSQVGNDF